MIAEDRPYRGRFAPSPSGPLHFGSLVAAVGSYLEARTQGGQWLLRIEDVDTPRTVPGAADEILRTLEAFGFAWDGSVLWQSQRFEAYANALDQLKEVGLAYGCTCSRKEIADSSTLPAIDGGLVYPGSCRSGIASERTARAWRIQVPDEPIRFADRIQGDLSQNLVKDVGDFVLHRADGVWAYQLAVTVDDEFQQISDVVRGADLLDSTARQIYLQSCLGYAGPNYAHLPVVTNAAGEKLSKQTLAPALSASEASFTLVRALRFLGQPVPEALSRAAIGEVWDWAIAHWRLSEVPRSRALLPE